jgi:hypothetical protein
LQAHPFFAIADEFQVSVLDLDDRVYIAFVAVEGVQDRKVPDT